MTTGPYTPKYLKEERVQVAEAETLVIEDPEGLPPIAMSFEDTRFFMLPNDPERKEWKIGLDVHRALFTLYDVIEKFFPSKRNCLSWAQPCFYTIRYPEDGIQIKEDRRSNILWCYGFTGHGFKHGPTIGRLVLNRIEQIEPKI